MSEEISRLMDGDLDDAAAEQVCVRLAETGQVSTWACYHVIGDTLRGDCRMAAGFSTRFATALAVEPTVLTPRRRALRLIPIAWAAAATVAAVAVVGGAAMVLNPVTPTVVATARDAATLRAAQLRPQGLPQDYLLAHQEYSPATAMQGVGPYFRAVAPERTDARP